MSRLRGGRGRRLGNDLRIVSVFLILALGMILILDSEAYEPPEDYVELFEERMAAKEPEDGGGEAAEEPATKEVELLERDGRTTEGESTEVDLSTEEIGVRGITVELEWKDDIGDNDELGLTLARDGDEVARDSGTSGLILLEHESGEEILGNLTVIVEALDCPGSAPRLPMDRDDGNDWHLSVTAIVTMEAD